MKVELDDQPITDIHCFSFAPRRRHTRSSMTKLFMAGGPTVMSIRPELRTRDLAASVPYRRMLHYLSLLFKTPDEEAEVLRERNKLAEEYDSYLRLLFEDARVERMALDSGLEPIPFTEFRKHAPAKLYRILRIEPLIKGLLEESGDFDDLLTAFDEAIQAAVRRRGFVGFKSVIAYRTGLDVGTPTEQEARASFRLRNEGSEREWFGPRVKSLRDFLLNHVAERSSKLGAFLQIHAGLGDTDVVADECNPLLLSRFLKQEKVMKIPVILIHGGFPYTDEAAWLSSVFPNLYFELSTPFPPTYLPALSKERLRRVLEVVPMTRIVYGSDSIETPEFHWLSAKLSKIGLGEVLGDLVEEGVLGEQEAHDAAASILDLNSRGLLG